MSEAQRLQIEDMLRAAPDLAGMTVEEMRTAFDQIGLVTPPDVDVTTESLSANGVNVKLIKSADVRSDRSILFCHSGGYVMGSLHSHLGFVSRVGKAARAPVFFVEYRLAPEHIYPAAVEDTINAYRWLLDSGRDPSTITFVGDSAGGTLVIAALLKAREENIPMPSSAVLLSPFADLTASGDSLIEKDAVDLQASTEMVKVLADLYLGGTDPSAPEVSPVYADLAGFPPLLLHVGTHEALLDDTLRLVRRAAIADVSVTMKAWPRLQHQWQLYAGMFEEGQESIDEAGEFIRQHFDR